jgi:hypothetical protein
MPVLHGARYAVQMQDRMHVHPYDAWTNVHLTSAGDPYFAPRERAPHAKPNARSFGAFIMAYSELSAYGAQGQPRLAAGGFPVL